MFTTNTALILFVKNIPFDLFICPFSINQIYILLLNGTGTLSAIFDFVLGRICYVLMSLESLKNN